MTFGADIDISAIHGLITDIFKILNLVFCFIIKIIMHSMLCLFFKSSKIRIY